MLQNRSEQLFISTGNGQPHNVLATAALTQLPPLKL